MNLTEAWTKINAGGNPTNLVVSADPGEAPGYDADLNPDIPDARSWSFKARRGEIDLTRILQESTTAGSTAVEVIVGDRRFCFVREDLMALAHTHGFMRLSLPSFAAASLVWRDEVPVVMPLLPTISGEPPSTSRWCAVPVGWANKAKRWIYRPIAVDVRGS